MNWTWSLSEPSFYAMLLGRVIRFLEACIPGTIRWLMNELTKSSTRRDGESPESYGGLIKRKKHHGEAFDELPLSMENW
jgi:hypothetical protein